jgi:AcrR family transcriptional regulator
MTAADTRRRILVIAADLFSRQGYTGTTIADIARELGTTTAALYYHFPSKADILGAMIDERLPRTSQQLTEQVIAVLAGPGADRSALIRAHAAMAVVKSATMAALGLSGGTLDRAGRTEVLDLALSTLRAPQEVSVPGHAGQE